MDGVVRIKITDPWKRFMYFVHKECQNGDITVRITKGQPTKLLKVDRDIRFDKDDFPVGIVITDGDK